VRSETLVAEMTVGYYALRESFTKPRWCSTPRRCKCTPPACPSTRAGRSGKVENRWSFAPGRGGCDVQFHICLRIQVARAADAGGEASSTASFAATPQAFEDGRAPSMAHQTRAPRRVRKSDRRFAGRDLRATRCACTACTHWFPGRMSRLERTPQER
jgi:hypothetical protein